MSSLRVLFLILALGSGLLPAAEKAEHVLVVVWDGLRPDFVTEANTPTLFKLAARGTFFQNNHSQPITSTEVNGTVLATGCFPAHSGLIANVEYRPALNPLKPMATENAQFIAQGDKLTQGKYLKVATLAEILRGDKRLTAIAGTKPVVLLLDRAPRADASDGSCCANLYQGQTLPLELSAKLNAEFGVFPAEADSKKEANIKQDQWTTKVFLEKLCADKLPTFATLWMSEGDYAQHGSGLGSEAALAGLKNCDDCLAQVLKKLETLGVLGQTDVIVVSDHGFSTISKCIDIPDVLTKAGFNAAREYKEAPKPGEIVVVGLGGTVLLYVANHDAETIKKLARFLQEQDFTTALFSREPVEGAFALKDVHLDSGDAPDLVLGLKWSADKSPLGVPGVITSEGLKRKPGQGNHASFSPFDVHNTLIAAGPDFKAGLVNKTPTGNIDLAPTVLAILGIKPPEAMDGRVLDEALVWGAPTPGEPEPAALEAQSEHEKFAWKQTLRLTKWQGRVYIEAAEGAATPK